MSDPPDAGAHCLRWYAKTAEDTEAFGARLAATRPQGNTLAILHLSGDLGAGKTTLARGFLRACGVTSAVRSPTYTLVEVYETSAVSVVHLDLYRLTDSSELEPLGLREWARPGYVWLLEWPERGGDRLPFPDLSVVLKGSENAHEINVEARSALGESWLSAVENSPHAP
jgi:tRNA threonylcarbamoyl adenosine modification protein YjeE